MNKTNTVIQRILEIDNFQNVEHLKFLLNPDNVDWAGGYLYIR